MTEFKSPAVDPGCCCSENKIDRNADSPLLSPPMAKSEFMSIESLPSMAISTDAVPAPLISAESAGASVWVNNKKINGLWSINQNRNCFAGVEGVGWKKLINTSDSSIVALNILASHALVKGSPVNYREESDGMIYEMYVW